VVGGVGKGVRAVGNVIRAVGNVNGLRQMRG
jgi:hypothetical protein